MGITERLQIIATRNEPLNKHVIWLKDSVFRKWDGSGWEIIGGTGGGGTTNYNELINKPKINGVVLQGDVELELGTNVEIIDNLDSTDKNKALSANQGKILLDKLKLKADKATTLAGYGITNAYTKAEVINAINEAIAGLGGSEYVEEIYKLNTSSFNASTYQTLLNAVNSNKVIIINDSFLAINKQIFGNKIYISSVIIDNTDTTLTSMFGTFIFNSDGTQDMKEYVLELRNDGTGNKFLNDKGEYVTVESGESYDLATQTSDGLMSKEDKIKLDGLGDASGIILTQAAYNSLSSYDNVVYFIKG